MIAIDFVPGGCDVLRGTSHGSGLLEILRNGTADQSGAANESVVLTEEGAV